MTRTGPVVCFGELLLRLSPPDRKLLLQAGALDVEAGGAEANVAAALASLGHQVRMLSVVPDNPLGRRARAALAAAGVDVGHVSTAQGRMGLYFLEQGAGSRPSTVTYDRAGSAFSQAKPDDLDFTSALGGAALLHISGINPALGPNGVALTRAVIAAAVGEDVPICFDGNYRAQLWHSWDSDPGAILGELLASATILIGNHRDIGLVLGREFTGEGSDRRRAAAEAAFAAFPKLELIASTARHIIDGDHHRISARVDRRTSSHQTADVDVTGIIDRVGTGDAFATGILRSWCLGHDSETAANSGLALCALKHSLPGDFCLIGQADLDAFKTGGGDIRR